METLLADEVCDGAIGRSNFIGPSNVASKVRRPSFQN